MAVRKDFLELLGFHLGLEKSADFLNSVSMGRDIA